jgi:hypothetical protein
MSVLAGSVAVSLAAKGASTEAIITNVLVALSVSTLFTGVLLFGVGALRLGQWLRFVPYPVIAGFLAASGLLLITGGVEAVTQTNLTLSPSSCEILYSLPYATQIVVGLLVRASNRIESRCVASAWVLCTARQLGVGTARWSPVSSSTVTSSKIRSAYPALASIIGRTFVLYKPLGARRSARLLGTAKPILI